MDTPYDSGFYAGQSAQSLASARAVLEILFQTYRPQSVLDVGCGVGTWLRAAKDLGATDTFGLDGSYVERDLLLIPQDEFLAYDLERERLGGVMTLRRQTKFDLVMSLEVAEHLSYERGATFVADLAELSDVILFSAAIPFQGGEHHQNEQWPEYWAILFRAQGFTCRDLLRSHVWERQDVAWWYAQNTLVFVKSGSDAASRFEGVPEAASWLAMVHPQNYLDQVLKWYHTHRAAAANEEWDDFTALSTAYAEGDTQLPHMLAPARALAEPWRQDVFPRTRVARSDPAAALGRLTAETEQLRAELAEKSPPYDRLYAELQQLRVDAERHASQNASLSAANLTLSQTNDRLVERIGEVNAANGLLAADLSELGQKLSALCDIVGTAEMPARPHELPDSRIVRLAEAYYRLYSKPVVGPLLTMLRRAAGAVLRSRVRQSRNDVPRIAFNPAGGAAPPGSRATGASPRGRAQPIVTASSPYAACDSVERILVVKLDHIGDFILGFQAFRLLRDNFPDADMTLLCGPWNRAIAEASGCFDHVECLSLLPEVSGDHQPEGCAIDLGAVKALNLPAFDIAIDFRDHHDTNAVLGAVEARFRAAFHSHKTAALMDITLPSTGWRLQPTERIHHQILQTLLAAAVVAAHAGGQALHDALDTVAHAAEAYDLSGHGDRPLIGIHIGSGAKTKNWPLDSFAELASRLITTFDARIVIFGSQREAEESVVLASRLPFESVINLSGRLTLPQAISTMKQLAAYVGNDTGTTHIAAALGIPTVCLFGTMTSFASHGVLGARCISLLATEAGMSSISVQDALQAAGLLLRPYVTQLGADTGPTQEPLSANKPADDAPVGLIVVDNKPFASDFRKYLMRAAIEAGGDAVHVRCWSEAVVTHRSEHIDTSGFAHDHERIADTICSLMGNQNFIILVGLGTDRGYGPLVQSLRRHPNAVTAIYDVFDYFRYDTTGRDFQSLFARDVYWRRATDHTILLDQGLASLYPGAWTLENASHMRRLSGPSAAERNRSVYIGSIDRRVDFDWLETFASLDVTLDIHGKPHDAEPEIEDRIRGLVERHPNVRFLGAYDNDELPRILGAYRIGILPYRRLDSMTRHISPDKVYHYLNAGLEVLASDIPQTRRLAPYLHLVRGPEDIPAALATAHTQPRADRWVVDDKTWEHRWAQLVDRVMASAVERE